MRDLVKWIVGLTLGLVVLAVAAVAAVVPTESTVDRAAHADAPCRAVTGSAQLLTSDRLGYCLLYPLGYTAEEREQGTILVVGDVLNHVDPRVDIWVEPANGRTAAEVAQALKADLEGDAPGMQIEMAAMKVGGREAVMLDRTPGQELSRVVYVVQKERLYRLTFTHADPAAPEKYRAMQRLYTTIVDSMKFIDG